MKKIISALLTVSLSVFVSVSCDNRRGSGWEAIRFVGEAVADTNPTVLGMLRNFDERRTEGTIAVIGEVRRGAALADGFLSGDNYDNVDGRTAPDGLPDFAGETVAVLLDEVNSPYGGTMTGEGELKLREVTVRNALMALDTMVRTTPYDRENLVWKAPAKVIVLSSPLMSEFGYYDLDTLCRIECKDVPVISPVHAMMKQAFASHGDTVNIGVWSDRTMLGSGAYRSVFDRMMTKERAASTLTEFCPDTTGFAGDRLLRFLEMYRRAGAGRRLDVLLIDDPDAGRPQLEARLKEIRRAESFSMMNYNELLSPEFEFIDVTEAVQSECYRLMRERNLFTHYVAAPKVSFYQTIVDEEHPGDAPYTLIELNGRYLDRDTKQFLEANSTAYRDYVSNQY